jgi:F-type H+-transporting ATPase subunit delta
MRGTSRASLSAAKERLAAALSGSTADAATRTGEELFAVVTLLDNQSALRRNLSDASIDGSARAGLAQSLLTDRVSATTVDQMSALAADRWSEPRDLVDAAEDLAVLAICAAADRGRLLDDVEDQLFRFGRIVGADPGLRYALSNQFVSAAGRRSLVKDLLDGKVVGPTLLLVSQAAAEPRGRSMDASLEAYASLAAALRERLVAEVHVVSALTARQRSRLVATLSAAYGHDIHLNVVIDPELIGGMSVRIGDELISGSVESRIAEVKRNLAA